MNSLTLVYGNIYTFNHYSVIISLFINYISHYENTDSLYSYYYNVTNRYTSKITSRSHKDMTDIKEFVQYMNNYLKNYFGFKFLFIDELNVIAVPYDIDEKLFIHKINGIFSIKEYLEFCDKKSVYTNICEKYRNSEVRKNNINVNYMSWYILTELDGVEDIETNSLGQGGN